MENGTKRLITEELDVPVKMRDGTILRCDVYYPAGEEKYPVLLQRTGYNKRYSWYATGSMFNLFNVVDRGYAIVIQDCRGTFASDGEHEPIRHERDDGYDTVEWCAKQPWSNGKVGIYGNSYMGYTSWQAVVAAPPHLAAAFIRLSSADPYADWVYSVGGAFSLGLNLRWCILPGFSGAFDGLKKLSPEKREASIQMITRAAGDWWSAYRYLPLSGIPVGKDQSPFYYEWLKHPSYDEYWRSVDVSEQFDKITVPICHMTGWYDLFIRTHFRAFAGIRQKGATEKARNNQKLLVGPWTHYNYLTSIQTKIGDRELGLTAIPNAEALILRWFDYWLKGINNGIMDEPPVRYFTFGSDDWHDADEWPLKGAKNTLWYLHSGGNANTLNGDGVLNVTPPQGEYPDTYAYDPADPVPTVGGRIYAPGIIDDGIRDQRRIEERKDVLVYSSALLSEDIEATGPVTVKLHIASSARDTDFAGKLVDVNSDGYAAIVADGILRVRYRESLSEPKLMKPGQIYELSIDLSGISWVFKKGHRIRLDIASSNFPWYDRNLNTGRDNGSETEMQTAIQTIYHDAEHPSQIVLPIVKSGQAKKA